MFIPVRTNSNRRHWAHIRYHAKKLWYKVQTYLEESAYYERSAYMSYLRKGKKSADVPADSTAHDPDFADRYPALHEYLTRTVDDDGEPRQTASLTIFAEDELFKCCLNDRECKEVAFYSDNSFLALMDGLEHSLQEGKLDWRKVGGKNSQTRR